VAISVGIPAWYKGRPGTPAGTDAADAEDAGRRVRPPCSPAILARLDPREVYERPPAADAVLLCWEQPGLPCHRRDVAAWFEERLGAVVPEWQARTPSAENTGLFPGIPLGRARRR